MSVSRADTLKVLSDEDSFNADVVVRWRLRGRVESPNVPLPYTEILIQLFGPKRVTQLLNYDIIEFPEEGYLLHFKLEFPEGENQLLYSCAY